jgi:hypothetical protein
MRKVLVVEDQDLIGLTAMGARHDASSEATQNTAISSRSSDDV